MTRRIDEFEQPISDEHYKLRHQDWPKSLAEQDAADARADRLRARAAERARKRVRAC